MTQGLTTQLGFSHWQKFDLHIHTNASNITKKKDYKGNFSIELVKKKLIENKVYIFSLTDHNIINVKAYKKYYQVYNDKTDPLLLLGIELDIKVKHKIYHSLVIFNHDDIKSVESISERLEKKYKDKNIADPTKRELTIDDIVEIFPKDEFFFIPHAGNTKSIVEAYKGNIKEAQLMVLLMPSVGIEKVVKEEVKRIYNEGFDRLLSGEFRNKKDIAYVEFSDNHCCESYPCKRKSGNYHKFYYIKGNKNYESIRLAFIDPESRLKPQESREEFRKQANYIKALELKKNVKIEDLDTDYDERSLFPTQVFFPMAGKSEGWSKLAKNLKAEVDKDKIEAYRGTLSLPFDKGDHSQVAVKIIDDRGIESIRILKLN